VDITFYLFFVALLVSFAGWCVFLWAIRTGQFHDVEDIKYQIVPKPPAEEQPEPTPERRTATAPPAAG
jgi:cbb3-type cytochrome oxidase maturation protein